MSLTPPRFQGAYYLAGYVVECALKACIARRTQADDFPPEDTRRTHYIHSLKDLARTAQLNHLLDTEVSQRTPLGTNWETVVKWDVTSRYDANKTQQDAKSLLQAIQHPTEGVLIWLQQRW
ncbi:MAG: hypothetical protein OHK0029_42210 [Armatimonadaceae bacterium]